VVAKLLPARLQFVISLPIYFRVYDLEKWNFKGYFFLRFIEITGIGIDDSLILKFSLKGSRGNPLFFDSQILKNQNQQFVLTKFKEPPNTSPFHKSIANYSIGHVTLVTMNETTDQPPNKQTNKSINKNLYSNVWISC
jgi:hypothetical protein